MRELDDALYEPLATDATLVALGVTDAYRRVAPIGAAAPYIVFNEQAKTDSYTLAGRSHLDVLYQIKAYEEGQSAVLAGDIDARIDAMLTDHPELLDAVLVPLNWRASSLRRESGVESDEETGGVTYQAIGGIYRVVLVRP